MKKKSLLYFLVGVVAALSGCGKDEPKFVPVDMNPVEVIDDSGFPVLENSKYPTLEEFNEKIVGKVWDESWETEDVMSIMLDGTLKPGFVELLVGGTTSTMEFGADGKMYYYGGGYLTPWPERHECDYTYEPATGIVCVRNKPKYRIVEVSDDMLKIISYYSTIEYDTNYSGYNCFNYHKSDYIYVPEPDPMSHIDKVSFDGNGAPYVADVTPLTAEEFEAQVVGSTWRTNYTYTILPAQIGFDGTLYYGCAYLTGTTQCVQYRFKDNHTVIFRNKELNYTYDPATGFVSIDGDSSFRLVDLEGDMMRYIYRGGSAYPEYDNTGYYLLRMERCDE